MPGAEPTGTIGPAAGGAPWTGDMDAAFRALADPTRRRLLDTLHDHNGQTLNGLCVGMHHSRQAISKHLGILEGAGLVTTDRRGRTKLHFLNPAPINDIAERWIHRYERARIDALTDLRRALEDHPVTDDRTEFRYVTYAPPPNACGRPSPTRPSPPCGGRRRPSTQPGPRAHR
jgi:DNA-binding transcriptional ArsR family regulator